MEEGQAFLNLVDFYVQKIVGRLGLSEAKVIFGKAVAEGELEACRLVETGLNRQDEATARCLAEARQPQRLDDLTALVKNLHQEYTALLGEIIATRDLEESVHRVTTQAAGQIPARLIRSLPLGVLEAEKTKLLSREELEALVAQRTQALQAAKNNLEKIVEERTALLKAERNKLSAIVYSISDGIIVTNRRSQIIVFNAVASRLTGFSQPEALGTPVAEILKLFDGERLIESGTFCPIGEVGGDQILFSQKGLKALGKEKAVYLDVDSSAIAEGLAADVGCLITLHDVTQEKELERMKLDFVSLAAHELRTPLTSIRGYLEVFIEENRQKFDQEQALFLDRIRLSANHLSSLVDNLLNVSRIERGTLTVNFESLNWPLLVSQIVADLQETAREKGISLQFLDDKKEWPPLTADKIRTGEVLNNLLTNALTYTAAGGQVTVSIEKEKEGLVTHVRDTGRGISPEDLPKLFTKFFRVSRSPNEASQGLGLGLYLSKAIIDLHQGRIWADANVDHGSTFSFFLPFKPPVSNSGDLKVKV